MWILIRYDLLNGHEKIMDLVANYDDLCAYLDALTAAVPSLKRISTDPNTMIHGQISPILGNSTHDWYIKYMVPVNHPTRA